MKNKQLKILAVDDIFDNLIALKALILEGFPNAQVVFARSGGEALSISRTLIPDIILLDVVMPEMDGFEVCKSLKSDFILKDIPVIFITALKGDRHSRIKGLEVGADAFLAKPIDESELVAQLRAMSKIRMINVARQSEQEILAAMVSEKTMQLEKHNIATLNLLEDLQHEVESRKKTEAELLKSQARLRRAELTSKSGNWEYNPENKLFNLSEGALSVLGFETEMVEYQLFVDLFVGSNRTLFEVSLKNLIEKNIPFNEELKVIPVNHHDVIDLRIYAVKELEDKIVFGVFRDITEHKIAREKLIESELKFRELMDNSPEGITIYVDGIIVYANKEAMSIMRASELGDLLGKSLMDFVHPENLPMIIERMQYVEMTPINNALPPVEEKYIRLDGSEVEVEIKVMPIIYDGKPAVQISGHDITNEKKVREEIEKNRKELKTIYDNAPVMMCVVNEKNSILFANNALNTFIDDPSILLSNNTKFGSVLGCSNSLLHEKGCGYDTKCTTCNLLNVINNTFETGSVYKNIDFQTTVIRGGELKKVALLASTSLIETEGEKKLLLCMHDITPRREAQEALYKSETLLRSFIENIPFGVWARDLNNRAIIENKILVENFGSIIATDMNNISDSNEFHDKQWVLIQERVLKGEVINEEVYYNVNGRLLPFQNIVFPIKTNNEIFGIAGISINISDRVQYQKNLLDYQKQLKNFAAHLQTVREDERLNLAREIHDDLGQVLVAIKFDLGMLGVKSKKFIKEEASEEFIKQFKRLEGYVNNSIKSARRIMTDLRPELLDMVGLVEAFKEHIHLFNERQSIKCEFKDKTNGVDLSSEKAVALFRILQESLNNAAKYSEASLITVELGTNDAETFLEITDNGIGFDYNAQKRSDSYGLVGMKERAYLLDGTVDIWSKPGEGVKIKVIVPR